MSITMSAIGAALFAGGLGGHAGAGVVLRHAAQPYEPVELGLGAGVHDDDEVVEGGEAVLGEEGDVVDDDGVVGRRPSPVRGSGRRRGGGRSR